MKRIVWALVVGFSAVAAGCAQSPAESAAPAPIAAPAITAGPAWTPEVLSPVSAPLDAPVAARAYDDRVVARINGEPVTMGELMRPLIEAHGLQMLIGLVQLDLLKQEARQDHVTVTPADIQAERDLTLTRMFKDADTKEMDQIDRLESKGDTEDADKLRKQIRSDREGLLDQYLDNQHFSRTEFDLKVEINTYLRKAADRLLAGKITDEMVEKEFGVEYGETAKIRMIQLANEQDVAEARRRLKAGQKFADVAREMSENKLTAPLGGKMIPFSRETEGLPKAFKDLAFTLAPGQVSDELILGDNRYLLEMEEKFPPKAVKFKNVKEALRKSMYARLAQATMDQLSHILGQDVVKKLKVEDPLLKKQYDQFEAQQESAIHDRAKMDEQWKKERETGVAATQPAATAPAVGPALAPATKPAIAPAAKP